jgi:casein kinase II subunit alpha
VFEAINIANNDRCVVKIMKPVKEARLRREIKILRHVAGGPNIVRMIELVRSLGLWGGRGGRGGRWLWR